MRQWHAQEIVDGLPFGIVVLDSMGIVQSANATAQSMLPMLAAVPAGVPCWRLLGCTEGQAPCAEGCLAARAVAKNTALPEIRIDADVQREATALWVTLAPLGTEGDTVLHLRPGQAADRRRRSEPHWITGPRLSVRTLGATRLETSEGPLDGEWLQQRPGQVLKYLLAERNRRVQADEIAEAIWPGSPTGITNVRYHICGLRDRLEPARAKRTPSSFITGSGGSYGINHRLVRIDADDFENEVGAGLAVADLGDNVELARATLERALRLYSGEFLADERYAEWAYAERERLNGLAAKGQRGLIRLAMSARAFDIAARHLQELAKLEPFDATVERELITIWLQQGRRSAAARRFEAFRARLVKQFGVAPPFDLASLVLRAEEAGRHDLRAADADSDWAHTLP